MVMIIINGSDFFTSLSNDRVRNILWTDVVRAVLQITGGRGVHITDGVGANGRSKSPEQCFTNTR
jgi:hypothetical protein